MKKGRGDGECHATMRNLTIARHIAVGRYTRRYEVLCERGETEWSQLYHKIYPEHFAQSAPAKTDVLRQV